MLALLVSGVGMGGGSSVVVTAPGIEFTLAVSILHFTLPDSLAQYVLPAGRMQFTLLGDGR